ncbi:MAG: hypothetical protein IKH82_01090 [Clostridiales bacterium]|nr:hypothetical protein [Clostridiales bacterium]MBR6986646.1 hypothetical protein [Clostridiales bacterium]
METEKRKRLLCICIFVVTICTVGILVACGGKDQIKTDVIIEAGSPITLEAFFDTVPDNAVFLTDVSVIDTNVPAVYQIKIGYGKKEADVIVRIEDHTGPTGQAVPMTLYLNWKMPAASDCVAYLYDLSGIAKVEYQEGEPVFTAGGEYNVPVLVTDVYGNSTVIQVPFTVIDDHTAPVIAGAHDLELEGNPDGLDFFTGVTVTDDYDPEPVIKIDDSLVDYTAAGTYTLTYKAVDKAGNIGTAMVNLTIKFPADASPSSGGNDGDYYVGDGDPYALARKVMANLYGSNDVETARNIFNWVHNTLWFRLLSGTRTYENAAYRGFTRHNGDCYVYYACCKMLLDIAGIENMRVDRYPRYNGNIHYWLLVKLNGEWYHCDATEGYNDHPGIWFMCTDDQINDRYHQFNGSLYPMRAGGSKDYLPSPTPTETPTPTPIESPTPSVDPSVSVSPTPTPSTTQAVDSPTPTPVTTQAVDSPTPTPTDTVAPTPTDTEAPTPTDDPNAGT